MIQVSRNSRTRLIADRFLIKRRIGQGSFGVLYQCEDTMNQQSVALKVEKNQLDEILSLNRENSILQHLKGIQGVPQVIHYGRDHNHNFLVEQLLSQDLSVHIKVQQKLNLQCVVNLADQLLGIIERIHNKSIIHRDIKPENILTGLGLDSQQVYIVDFGVSKFFKDTNGNHIPFDTDKPFIGTTRYGSIAAHQGHEQGRKDDLESLGYMFIYMLKGQLPWQNMKNVCEKDKNLKVGEMKQNIKLSELCKDLPEEFQRYFDHIRQLTFKQQPDYKYLKILFSTIALQHKFIDKIFNWGEPSKIIQVLNSHHKYTLNSPKNSPEKQVRGRQKHQSTIHVNGSNQQSPRSNNSVKISELGNILNPQFSSLFNSQNQNFLELPKQTTSKGRNISRHKSEGNNDHPLSNLSAFSQGQSSIYMVHQTSNLSSFSPQKKKSQIIEQAMSFSQFDSDQFQFIYSQQELEMEEENEDQSTVVAQFMNTPIQNKYFFI